MSKSFRSATEIPPMNVLPTGIANLDFATRVGGIPTGTQVEIFGREAVGKSLMTYYMIAEAQRRGHKVAYIDLEGTFEPKWAKYTSKLSLKDLDMADPLPGQEAVATLDEAVKSNEYRLIIFDSLGCMVDDTEKDITKMRVGGTSLLISHMVNNVNPYVRQNNCIVVYINQARESFNSYGVSGSQEEAPGGRAKRHMCSIRIHLRPGEPLNHKGEKIGFRVKAKIIKNKVGTPNQTASWNVWNQPDPVNGVLGIDLIQDIIDTSLNEGIIKRSGAWYSHGLFGEKPLQGTEAVFNFLSSHPEGIVTLKQEVLDLAKEVYSEEVNGQ